MKSFQKRIISVAFACCVAFVAPTFAAKEPPVPVRTVAPSLPSELKGTAGLVMVKCTIDEQGNVAETSISKSSNEAFDRYAIEAIKKWKFKPASEDGKAVSVSVTIPVKFVGES